MRPAPPPLPPGDDLNPPNPVSITIPAHIRIALMSIISVTANQLRSMLMSMTNRHRRALP